MFPSPSASMARAKAVTLLLAVHAASAASFFNLDNVPKGLTSGCSAALTAVIACPLTVAYLQPDGFYPKTTLDKICTPGCDAALISWKDSVLSSCVGETFPGFEEDGETGVGAIPEVIRYTYGLICLKEGGNYCNNAAASFAANADPEAAALPGGMPGGGDWGGLDVTDECDACLVSLLRFRAGSPYYGGPELQQESVYESRTSSCSVTGAPLTTSSSPFEPTPVDPPTSTCAGVMYTIQPGDDCNSISLSEGIGTEWLIIDNDLSAFCRDFPESGELCLQNRCEVYTVVEDDTCKSIAKEYEITEAQLYAWNPSVNAGCFNLKDMVGTQLCVSKPGPAYVPPTETEVPPVIPTSPVPVPTDIADETTDYCGRYHKAIVGDFCNQLVMKYSISLEDFIFLNPAINENCTNLFAEESYCVQPVGDINTYPGRPGHVTYTFTATGGAGDLATNLPDVVWSSPTQTTTLLPLATDTRADCYSYLDGDKFQRDMSGMMFASNCELVAEAWDVTLEDLGIWNPSLGDASDPDCAFESGVRYCAKYYSGFHEGDGEADDTGSDYPGRDGMTANCTATIDVDQDGNPTCEEILDNWEITIAQFYEWNPSVGEDCSGMWASYHYCVRADGFEPPTPSPTTSDGSTPTEGPTPPGPTLDGQPENCSQWHLVEAGDDCSTIEAEYSLSHADFLLWNPAVSEDCVTGFWGGYAYCVAVGGASPEPTTTTSAEGPGNTPVPAPEPNQAGNAVEECNAYGQAQAGDWCAAFADRHGVELAELYAWNTVLGAGGEGCAGSFWAGYWYCIGVAA